MKEEPDVHITHRKEKLMCPERVIHPSGKLCKTHNKGGYWDDELPDLVPPSSSTTATKESLELKSPPRASRCSTRISSRLVATPVTCVASLLSGFFPESTSTMTSRFETTTVTPSTNTNTNTIGTLPIAKTQEQSITSSTSDVLSGYLPIVPARDVTTPRVGITPNMNLTPASNTAITLDITSPVKAPRNEESTNIMPSTTSDTRTVPTYEATRNVKNVIPDGIILDTDMGQTRIVTTNENDTIQPHMPTEIENLLPADVDEMDSLEINEAAARRSALHALLDDPTPSRDVATTETGLSLTSDTEVTEGDAADS